jgi:hypothetical protein
MDILTHVIEHLPHLISVQESVFIDIVLIEHF